jgi:hypothetical protein
LLMELDARKYNKYTLILNIKSKNNTLQLELVKLFYHILDIDNLFPKILNDVITTGNCYVYLKYGPTGGISGYDVCENIIRNESVSGTIFLQDSKEIKSHEMLHFRFLLKTEDLPYGTPIDIEKCIQVPSGGIINRRVERVCRMLEGELKKAALIHLYANGYKDESLSDFDLELYISYVGDLLKNFSLKNIIV